MSDTYRRLRVDRYDTMVGDAVRILTKIDHRALADIMRRSEVGTELDGLRSANLEGGGGSSEDTPVEREALRGLPDDEEGKPERQKARDDWRMHQPPDPIGKAVDEALAGLEYIIRIARDVDRRINVVQHAADGYRGRQSTSGPCKACGRDVPGTPSDRLHSGYCEYKSDIPTSGCHTKFIRAGRPDRFRFELAIQDEVRLIEATGERTPLHIRTGYEVDELDGLMAAGTLPAPSKGAA